MSMGMHSYGSGRRTWAKWRERNTGHYDEAIQYERGSGLRRVPEVVSHVEFTPDQSAFMEALGRPPFAAWQMEMLAAAYRAKGNMEAAMETAPRRLNNDGGVAK